VLKHDIGGKIQVKAWLNNANGGRKGRYWREGICDLVRMQLYKLAEQAGGSGKTARGLSTRGAPPGSDSSLGTASRFTFNPRSLLIERRNGMRRMHQFGNV
jgi:hypothetical protein